MLRIVAAVLAFLVAPVLADERTVPTDPAQVNLSFAPIVAKVRPSVVNVYASRVEEMQRNPFMDDPFFRHFFGGGEAQGQNKRVSQ